MIVTPNASEYYVERRESSVATSWEDAYDDARQKRDQQTRKEAPCAERRQRITGI